MAGFAVGALAIVGINGARRSSRGVPVVADRGARRGPPPPSHAYPQQAPDHGIRVNQPSAPPPPPPAAPVPTAAGATAVATGPALAKRPTGATTATGGGARLEVEGGSDGVDLRDAVVTLGRGNDQVLRIKDSRASRAHAVVRRRSKGRDGWEV